MPPKVSVNICCYNSERYLKETIQSVLDQSFKDYEVIIVDDGSKDNTGKIVKSFTDPRLKYYYQENRGLSASRNRAISLSSGEYIALLDHDDLWQPDKLAEQINLLDNDLALGAVFSDAYIIDGQGNITGTYFNINRPARGNIFERLILANFIPCLTVMIRQTSLRGLELFKQDFRIAEEYELFLRIAERSSFDYIDKPLASYRWHENNYSFYNSRRSYYEELAIVNYWLPKITGNKKLFFKTLIKKLRLSGLLVFSHAKRLRGRAVIETLRNRSPLFNDLEQASRLLLVKIKIAAGRRHLSVNLDTNNCCNLTCKYCHENLIRAELKEPPLFLSLKDYEMIARQIFPLTQRLFLSCATEPLLTRNFINYVKIAKQYHVPTIGFVTNGLLFNDDLIKQCVEEQIDIIQFSIDAATPETFAEIRGGDFRKLIDVMEKFRKFKTDAGTAKPEIQANYTIFDRNAAELPLFINNYHHLFQQINLGNLIKTDDRVPYHRLREDEFQDAVRDARRLGGELGIGINGIYYQKKRDTRRARCFQPYYFRNIDCNGDIRICSGEAIGSLLKTEYSKLIDANKQHFSALAALRDRACLDCW